MKYPKARRQLTPKEIAYYKDVEDFAISEPLDDKIADNIASIARGDIAEGNKKKTAKDFKNAKEYEWYRAVLYDTAVRAENGFDW